MNKSIFQTLALFVLLAIVQVLVCNNISILNFATPFVFIYVIAVSYTHLRAHETVLRSRSTATG